jgi:hypothetical protein
MSFTLPVKDPCRACGLYSSINRETNFCSQCQQAFEEERQSLNEGIAWFERYFGIAFTSTLQPERLEALQAIDDAVDVDLTEIDAQLSDALIEQARRSLLDIVDDIDGNREGHE